MRKRFATCYALTAVAVLILQPPVCVGIHDVAAVEAAAAPSKSPLTGCQHGCRHHPQHGPAKAPVRSSDCCKQLQDAVLFSAGFKVAKADSSDRFSSATVLASISSSLILSTDPPSGSPPHTTHSPTGAGNLCAHLCRWLI